MSGEPASFGPPAFAPRAATLTTIPLDSVPHAPLPAVPSLHWQRSATAITIRAPRTRHLLPAVAGALVTCVALGLAALRLASLPAARDGADRLGSMVLLILPCLFGLMGLLALVPLFCPPRLRLDASGATLRLAMGMRFCRRHLPTGTFELRTHEWSRTAAGPAKLATLFLHDRANHAWYPVFHRYPAAELAEILMSLGGTARPAAVRP